MCASQVIAAVLRTSDQMGRSLLAVVLAGLFALVGLGTAAATGESGPKESLESRLKPSGLAVDEVRVFFRKLQAAFAAEGCGQIAELVSYPLLLPGSPDAGKVTTAEHEPAGPKIATPQELEKRCPAIVTQRVRDAVREQDVEELWANWRGVVPPLFRRGDSGPLVPGSYDGSMIGSARVIRRE